MKRLVYSPSVKAWVKTDFGVVDLTPYITECTVVRKIDETSQAELEFRNPKVIKNGKSRFLFTEYESDGKILPVFHPMDPVTIVFERIAGRPIQVFTGYCDTTPYVQLFPGTARIKASCTLKRLNYTYFDPGLNFVDDFMRNYGWTINKNTGVAVNEKQATKDENPEQLPASSVKLHDSSIGNLLYATLNEIGGWNENNVYIQDLPSNIGKIIGKLFDEFAQDNKDANEEVIKLVRSIIGSGNFGKAVASGAITPDGQPDYSDYRRSSSAPQLPDNTPEEVKNLFKFCDKMAQEKTHYVYGGSHDANPLTLDKGSLGYILDCSSFVSYVLSNAGFGVSTTMTSGGFLNWGKEGVGQYFTVWTRDNPKGHVFIEFYGKNNTSSCIGTNTSKVSEGHSVSWHTHPTTTAVPRLYPRHWKSY